MEIGEDDVDSCAVRVPPLDKPHRTQQVGLGPTTPYINDAPGSILKGRGAKKRRLCEGRVNRSHG